MNKKIIQKLALLKYFQISENSKIFTTKELEKKNSPQEFAQRCTSLKIYLQNVARNVPSESRDKVN